MDMVTAAVVMSAGAAQASVLSATPERAPVEGKSFAKSFDEGVAFATDAPAQTGSDEGAGEWRGFRRGAALKIADARAAASAVVKAGSVAGPLEAARSGGNAFAAKIASMTAGADAAPAGLIQGKKLEGPQQITGGLADIGAGSVDGVESVAAGVVGNVCGGEYAVNGVGSLVAAPDGKVEVSGKELQAQQNASVVAAPDEVAAQQVIGKGQGQPVVFRDAEVPSGKIKTAGPEEMGPAASTKKISKDKDHKGTHAKTAENTGAIGHVTVVAANTTPEGGAAAGVSVPVATTAPVGMPSNEAVKGQKGGSGKTTSTRRGSDVAAASAVAGKSDKDVTGAGKTAPASGTAVLSADGAGPVQSAAPAIGADGDRKNQKGDAVAVAPHGAVGEGSALAGLVSGVAPSHLAGGVVSAKSPTQDGQAAATAALHAEHGELDGSGAAMASGMDGGHRTLTATPTTLEVGIASGTHGWLKIRAEMATGGVVNASVSAATPTGQEMLHRELPSLTAYLQQEQVAVNTVVVHSALAGNTSHGVAGGMAGDMSGQAQQRSSQGGEGRQGLAGTVSSYADEAGYESASRTRVDELLSPTTYVGGGNWLNVRA